MEQRLTRRQKQARKGFIQGMLYLVCLIILCGLVGPYKQKETRPMYNITDHYQLRMEAECWIKHYLLRRSHEDKQKRTVKCSESSTTRPR